MASAGYNLLSLNVRGLNNYEKRKAVFRWLDKGKFDIILLQETHSTVELESVWKRDWPGSIFFSHGTGNSRGCCILVRDTLEFNSLSVINDDNGRFVILQALIVNEPVTIVNVYAPNVETEHVNFIDSLDEALSKNNISNLNDIVMGGDWNVVRDSELDKSGGNFVVKKRSVDRIEILLTKYNLNDTWRIKHPSTKRYTWRQSNPLVQCRLDYWLISDSLFDKVHQTDIIPSIRSDHSAILVKFQHFPTVKKGPNFWKFNSSLLNDKKYVDEMIVKLQKWRDEYDMDDKSMKWELMKYEIRKYTIEYSKIKKRESSKAKNELEKRLCYLERNLSANNNINEYNDIKQRLKSMEDEIIRGQIIRSKVQWYEEGERSTKYFLGLEKQRSIKKHVQKLELPNGRITTEAGEILKTAAEFYKQLYKSEVNNRDMTYDSVFSQVKSLDEFDKNSCDGVITNEECKNVVKNLKNNKTPGNDGISSEFYQYFWPQIGDCVVDSFNFAYTKGILSQSQRQAIITLIDKGKDRNFIENWRPISILNTDYKIASKVLALRLQDKIPKLVGISQTGYVKGRFINDSMRTLCDIIEYCKLTDTKGLLMMVDFKKAFDSLDWNFIFKTLEKMNFGSSFINWVKLFYNDIESCVINNGITSPYFKIERGVRQGDPLSAYLFILCVEIMSNRIMRNRSIRGITVNDTEFKLLQYADDTTAILKDEQSAREFLIEIELFGTYSGLNVNTAKTKAINLGIQHNFKLPGNIKWCNEPMKVLGIYVGWNIEKAIRLTFDEKIGKIKKLLNSWKARKLTLNGKVIIIKSLAISQLIYLLNLLPFPDDIMKEIEIAIYEFLWNGKTHKVKKSVIIQNYKDGGCKMIDLRTLNMSQKLKWLKLYLNCHECQWRYLMDAFIEVKNVNIFLRNCYDLNNISTKSMFYCELLNLLYRLNTVNQHFTNENINNHYIFYNKYIKIGGEIIYDDELFKAGMWRCSDIFDVNGNIIPFNVWKSRGVQNCKYFIWRAVVSIVCNFNVDRRNDAEQVSNMCILLPTDEIIDLNTACAKEVYRKLLTIRKEEPTGIKYYKELFLLNEQEMCNIFIIPRMCTKDMVIKELQFKILHKYLPTNVLLYKMKKVVSTKCTFCNMYDETISHVFYECFDVKNIWLRILPALQQIDHNITKLSVKDIVLGYSLENITPSSLIINNLILHVKTFLWKYKNLELLPSYFLLKQEINRKKNLEVYLEMLYSRL